nr:uncharacterized protein LOC109155728 [Ipomoea batatas]
MGRPFTCSAIVEGLRAQRVFTELPPPLPCTGQAFPYATFYAGSRARREKSGEEDWPLPPTAWRTTSLVLAGLPLLPPLPRGEGKKRNAAAGVLSFPPPASREAEQKIMNKKQMKLKKDDGMWAFVEFRKADKPFGAWLRAGSRRAAPTSGQRWVAPESDADRLGWKSRAMEAVEAAKQSEKNESGKEPMQMSTGPAELVPFSDSSNEKVPASTSSLTCPYSDHMPLFLSPAMVAAPPRRKRFCFDNMWLREDIFKEIVEQSWYRTAGLDILDRVAACSNDIWRWDRNYNKEFQKRIDRCSRWDASDPDITAIVLKEIFNYRMHSPTEKTLENMAFRA